MTSPIYGPCLQFILSLGWMIIKCNVMLLPTIDHFVSVSTGVSSAHKTQLDSKHIWIETHSFSLHKRSHLISLTIEYWVTRFHLQITWSICQSSCMKCSKLYCWVEFHNTNIFWAKEIEIELLLHHVDILPFHLGL